MDERQALEDARRQIDPFGFGHDCARRAMCRCERCDRFTTLLDAGAYLDAAMMLVPDEWTAWELRSRGGKKRFVAELTRLDDDKNEVSALGHGSTPSAALLAAILAARSTKP